MPLTPAEKQRRYRQRLKENPEKNAEAKTKHLERYHRTKKLVKDMTEREHRSAKRRWKIANKKRREREKAAQPIIVETPASTPRPGTPISPTSRGRRNVRRDRSKVYRLNMKLQQEIDNLKKKYNKYKKRYQRQKEKKSKSEDKKYSALSNAIKDHYKNIKGVKERRTIRQILQSDHIQNSRVKVAIVQETLGINTIKLNNTAPKQAILAKKITEFFNRDDDSRATAGKRETVTYKKIKAQKRYLLDTMTNLYISFIKENPNERCSYSYFTKQRPFYVKTPTADNRDTCLCKIHVNTEYMLNTLYRNKIISESNLTQVIENTVCSTDNQACMRGNCDICKTKSILYNITNPALLIKWPQWVRKSEIIDKTDKKVKVTKNVKETVEGTVKSLTEKFNDALITLKSHTFNIKIQYKSYRAAIDNLQSDEVVIHIDFSENYSCKHTEEIQSHHFGGSRQQVILHTGVLYLKPEGTYKPQVSSFCSISGNHSHNPAAIWAHLYPVIMQLKSDHPYVKTLHVFSDGPATQYRQKVNFYFICKKPFEEYDFDRITWNFFEAGHGKGAADGVGGCLKRTADRKVATGTDIPDAKTFYETLKEASKIQLYFLTDEDIKKVESTVPKDVIPLRGTMQVHQVFSDTPGKLQYRDLSCFCQRGFCTCLSPKTFIPILESTSTTSQYELEGFVNVDFETDQITDQSPERYADINEEEVLTDIVNIINKPRKTYFETVYSPSSSDDDEPLSKLQSSIDPETSVSNQNERDLIEKENVHPSKIHFGVYVIIKVCSDKDKSYSYLGVAQSDVDEEGEIKIMFYKCVDDSGRRFKANENDISFEPYENILQIVSNPKIVKKGKRVYYEFKSPIDIFEK